MNEKEIYLTNYINIGILDDVMIECIEERASALEITVDYYIQEFM